MNLTFNFQDKARFGEDVRYLEHGRIDRENFSITMESQIVFGKTQLWRMFTRS